MEPRQIRMMKIVLLASSLASLLVLATAAYRENFQGQWRALQEEYRGLLVSKASGKAGGAATSFEIEHKQIYLADLDRIDRCTTCHLGVENPAMLDAEQPFTQHPGRWLAQHPPDQFGCTVCHGGQSRAVARSAAHGWHDDGSMVKHAIEPLLRGEAVYTSCGRCHAEIDLFGGESDLYAKFKGRESGHEKPTITDESLDISLPVASALAEGKRLTVESGCLGCHKYRGRGGTLGPELTYVGDKTKHDFDFTHVKGEHTVEQWLYEHFMQPREISPDTTMPDMGLSDAQAHALTLYMMSLHKKSAPASHTPPPDEPAARSKPVTGDRLYAMFCSACHGADGYGTTMRTGLWPQDADPWGHDWDSDNVMLQTRSDLEVLVPSLHHPDTLATASDDYLRHIIAEGRPGTKMPAWDNEGGLSDDEITLLVDHVRSWERPVPSVVNVSAHRGNARVGGALYRANCAACHGSEGQGGIGNSLNSPTFLAVASDAFLRDTIVHGRPNTAMPAWREFDSQELSDLIAFMRRWQRSQAKREQVLALAAATQPAAGEPEVSVGIGRTLYKANCVMCHGRDGSGDLAPSLNTQAFLTVVSDEYLVETLMEGRPGTGMPNWRHLSSADVASLVMFIRTWQTQPSKSEQWHDQMVPRGDWDAGRFLFAGSCAGCHGPDGEGATGPQLNNKVFLRTASDVMLREWIAHGKEGTEMQGFRKGGQGITELTDRQIEDIIAHLRRLERMDETAISRTSKSPHGRPDLGADLYVNNCAGCHGDRGEGASGPALSNPNFLRYASDGFLMATLALGREGTEMRPAKRGPQSILGLSSNEVNDLVAYLRSWEHDSPYPEGKDVPHRFVVPWDLARGRDLFASNCAGCHGDEGKGMWAPELNNEGFLAAATDGFLQATIVRGRKGTAMRPFGRGSHGLADLTEQDIDDIVAYMRHWSIRTPSPLTVPAEQSLERLTEDPSEREGSAASEIPGHTRMKPADESSAPRPGTPVAAAIDRIQGD